MARQVSRLFLTGSKTLLLIISKRLASTGLTTRWSHSTCTTRNKAKDDPY